MPKREDKYGFGVTIPPTAARVIDAGTDIAESAADKIDFLHSVLCQVGMPRRRQEARTFERTSGNASLLLEAGRLWDGTKWQEQPLPYGTRPRLAMIHVSSQAVRDKSRVIEVGHSMRDFLVKLGIDTSGRGYATFRKQMSALAVCRLTLGMANDETAITVDAKPFHRFEAWLHSTGQQGTMWPGELELSQEFYDTLIQHAVPLDDRAVAALKHSAMALDVYTWLAHRLHRVKRKGGDKVSWRNMRDQFGQEYAQTKDFKRTFQVALRQVLSVYPDAKIEPVTGGLLLKSSPPPIRKRLVQGR